MIRECIFCHKSIDPQLMKPEHIIPDSVDGTLVTYSICLECNSALGTQVDAELNRHRHIWDARKAALLKHPLFGDPSRPFRFQSSWFEDEGGNKIRMDLKSNSSSVHRTELAKKSIVYGWDCKLKDDEYYKFLLGEKKRVGMSDDEFEKHHVQRYLTWRSNPTRPLYEDWLFNSAGVSLHDGTVKRMSLMNADTPVRFIAKACVEFADLIEYSDNLREFEQLSRFARYGGDPHEFRFLQDFGNIEEALPFHILGFSDSQFIIAFYGYFHIGVNISWKNEIQSIITANDIVNRCQRLCVNDNEQTIALLDRTLEIKMHHDLKLKSHIKK